MPPKKSKAKAPSPSPATAGLDDKDMVVKLAYELYVRRGGEHGHDVEDWLMAEQMLLEQQKKRSEPSRRAADAARRVEDKFRRR